MRRHHTKDKGDVAVAKVHADLVHKGALVLFPLTEHAPFDLVAYLDGAFFRVQVKYRSERNGTVRVDVASTWADRHGVHRLPMPRDEVDVVAIYCPDTDLSYYLDPTEHGASVTLRVSATRNGQQRGVRAGADHFDVPPRTTSGVRPGPAVGGSPSADAR